MKIAKNEKTDCEVDVLANGNVNTSKNDAFVIKIELFREATET